MSTVSRLQTWSRVCEERDREEKRRQAEGAKGAATVEVEAEHIAHMLKKAGRISRRRRRNTAEASTLGKLVTWPRDGGMWACNCCRGRCNNLSEVGSSRQRQQQQQEYQNEQLESGDKNLKENYENCAQLTQFPLHFSTTCNYFF